MDLYELSKSILSLLTILAQAGLAAGFAARVLPNKPKIVVKLLSFFSKNASILAVLVSLFATISSLFLSEILGLAPCNLCWFQRALMYPIPAILLFSLIAKGKKHFRFVLPLVLGGAAVSLYHIYLQLSASFSPFCPSNPTIGSSCSSIGFAGFGYVTIPVMALTGFLAIGFLASLSVGRKQSR
ncbi:MAG: disulfide bond formation protein B [archaeon]